MTTLNLKIGQVIETKDGRQGTVRYIGGLHIAEGEWLGLELSEASGKNDGSVKGERYFRCQQNFGIFVRKESVVRIVKQAPSAPIAGAAKVNGSTTNVPNTGSRPRPSSGITPELARKRQSLMSAGSNVTAATRLSLRSPTKSPSKALSSTASTTNTSATSTPRTGTPATTTRTSDSSAKSRLSVSSRTSAAPTNSTSRTTTHAPRLSLAGGTQRSGRPASIGTKPLLSGTRASVHFKPSTKPDQQLGEEQQETSTPESSFSPILSDNIASSDGESAQPGTQGDAQDDLSSTRGGDLFPATESASATPRATRTMSTSRTNAAIAVENRAAQVRDMEKMKVKIQTLEKQRDGDQEKLRQYESVQSENERYKSIIQALQNKLRANQQELVDTRSRYEEVQKQASSVPERTGEQESELELATLDKEMAEEKAETIQMELDALRAKHEELELEVEILREENQELATVMSPEEKASAGWLQMEREKDRLREALLMLRDMTQESESSLKTEIKELQRNLDEIEPVAAKYTETAENLSRAEETNKHLMEQLEAIESNDEVVEAMEVQREQHLNVIEQLKRQVQELEEHIQVTEELENFHLEEEKRLLGQLDEAEALLNESHRQNSDQDRVVEDLEYTLTKFRDVVQGLQSDIDELRRSREISEMEANEMSSKSRAMMDLNLRLQSNSAKAQSKVIDAELARVQAKLGKEHVEMLNLFTLESYASEKNSVLALLCFEQLEAKAKIVAKLLGERLRERSHLAQGEEIFKIYEVVEQLHWIAATCQRFESFMSMCTTEEFLACAGALYELEPVERALTTWLEALRKDELSNDGPEHFKRMQGILIDLSDKLIIDSIGTRASQTIAQCQNVENCLESLAGQLSAIVQLVQAKLGGVKSEDEESLVFDKKMDQLITKSRTMKYLSNKAVQQLVDMKKNSLCLEEAALTLFDDTEHQAHAIVKICRQVCVIIVADLSKFEPEEPLTYRGLIDKMTAIILEAQNGSMGSNGISEDDSVFALLGTRINNLQLSVDELVRKSADFTSATEFESNTAPWIVRAKELRAQKTIAPEVQDEISRLERRIQELGARMVEKEKTIEEMNMRVELAEKRMKDSRARDDREKANQEEVERLRAEHEGYEQTITRLKSDVEAHVRKSEQNSLELAASKQVNNGAIPSVIGTPGIVDERAVKQAQLEVSLLQAEIAALQAAVRFLREENLALRVPVTDTLSNAARNTWLEPPIRPRHAQNMPTSSSARRERLEQEAKDIYSNLIDVASSLKPIRLTSKAAPVKDTDEPNGQGNRHPLPSSSSSWQPTASKSRYTLLKQREEWENWQAQKNDFVQRAKIINSTLRQRPSYVTTIHHPSEEREPKQDRQRSQAPLRPRDDGSNLIPGIPSFKPEHPEKQVVIEADAGAVVTNNAGQVRIVES